MAREEQRLPCGWPPSYTFFFFFFSLFSFPSCPTWRILNPPCTIDESVNFVGRDEAKANALFHFSLPPYGICTKGEEKPWCVGDIDKQG